MNFVMMPVPEAMFTAVCALLGSGVSIPAPAKAETPSASEEVDHVGYYETVEEAPETPAASNDDAKVDSSGVPFDPELHTGTLKKDGTWRMKKGVSSEATGMSSESGTSSGTATSPTVTEADPAPSDTTDDEFAAFMSEPEPVAAAPARKWTDADLGKLCNQTAAKIGGARVPEIKATIAKYLPEGTDGHSRNIPAEKREAFAKDMEATFGVEYEG